MPKMKRKNAFEPFFRASPIHRTPGFYRLIVKVVLSAFAEDFADCAVGLVLLASRSGGRGG
jgi:hypothetical protein